MEYDFLYKVDNEGVATITLNRPDVLNALTFEIYGQLRDLFTALRRDDAVKAVVITGEGRAFCSGGDVYEIIAPLLAMDAKDLLDFTRMTGSVVQNMRHLDKPIIAAVNGMAAGAGAVLALAADLRILSAKGRFAFLFTKVGLAGADMGAAYLLPRIVGHGRSLELLYFGDTIDAATAERYGLGEPSCRARRASSHRLRMGEATRSRAGPCSVDHQATGKQRAQHGSGLRNRQRSTRTSAADARTGHADLS